MQADVGGSKFLIARFSRWSERYTRLVLEGTVTFEDPYLSLSRNVLSNNRQSVIAVDNKELKCGRENFQAESDKVGLTLIEFIFEEP